MRFVVALLGSVAILAACVAATGTAASSPIILGCQCDLTGAAGFAGIGGEQGIQMALAQINAHGGINGRKIKLVVADSQTTPDGGVLAVRQLIQQDHANIIISVASSTATIAAAPVATSLHIPLIATAAGDPRVLYPFSKYIYRGAAVNIAASAKTMANLAVKAKAKAVAVMTDTSLAYAVTERSAFLADAKSAGVNVVTTQTWSSTDTDFTSQIQALKSAKPDLIFVMAYPPATAKFMTQLRNSGITTQVVGDQSLPTPALLALGGTAVEGMELLHIGTQVIADTSGPMGQWLTAFKKMFPSVDATAYPNDEDLWGYADTFVIADAIRRAGSNIDGDSLVAQLDKTNGFVAGRGKIFYYAYPIGQPRTWNSHDHEGTRALSLLVVKNGKYLVVPNK